MTVDEAIALGTALDSPHLDVGPLLGLSKPLKIGLDDLHNFVTKHGQDSLSASLQWDGGTLIIANKDGGAMAILEIKF